MKREDIDKAVRLSKELDVVEKALKATHFQFTVPDMCGVSHGNLTEEAMHIVKEALRMYANRLKEEIENL